jgi:hypothetical protein
MQIKKKKQAEPPISSILHMRAIFLDRKIAETTRGVINETLLAYF